MNIVLPNPGQEETTSAPLQCTTTSIEVHETLAKLPQHNDRSYLYPKVRFSMQFPNIGRRTRNGDRIEIKLKQNVLSGIIRFEEFFSDFYWHYKAEVCFDMTIIPPKPFLISGTDPNRRHACRPTVKNRANTPSAPHSEDFIPYRRPDIIIVKNDKLRWPGLADTDHTGGAHPDNLARLVEVKFPGDRFGQGQERDYLKIVRGDRSLFTLLEVLDCRDEGDKQGAEDQVAAMNALSRTEKYSRGTKEKEGELSPAIATLPDLLPVNAYSPLHEPFARMQPWVTTFAENTTNLLEGAFHTTEDLGADCLAAMRSGAAWLFEQGEWVYEQTRQIYRYGEHLFSLEALSQAWQQISQQASISLEHLMEAKWAHILAWGLGTVAIVVGFVFGGELITFAASLAWECMVILRLLIQFGRPFAQQLLNKLPALASEGQAALAL